METLALDLKKVTKSFASNQVLKGVSLSIAPGQITALLGANGAGKSTLIKVLSGVHHADDGVISIAGQEVEIKDPLAAAAYGIQTVHQQVSENIVPGLTVAENLCFAEIVQGKIPAVASTKKLLPRAREIAQILDLDWDDNFLLTDVFELGIADAQLILIARALIQKPKVLILDEPTSTLSEKETQRLFRLIKALKKRGTAILYVSHHLAEIDQLADNIVVLRDGIIVASQSSPFDLNLAVSAMLGKKVVSANKNRQIARGVKTAAFCKQIRLLKRSKPIDLELRYGEVTGITGLIGSGKSELLRQMFGAEKIISGEIKYSWSEEQINTTAKAKAQRVYLVSEDRVAESILPQWSVQDICTLPFLDSVSVKGILDKNRESKRAWEIINSFAVVGTPEMSINELSGGNQQKVVVGRWLIENPKVMLLDEPFRGVDIGARADICRKLKELAQSGVCVVVASSDVEEIQESADRVIVLVDGEITLDKYIDETDESGIISAISEVR